ncbi:hypothetical protein BGZ47_007851 [Haplosporangium gracile]|nr:hypothetical protein BGZ47_007851 [Haplosporangium gracile]
MYTVGCNFDKMGEADTCREYEYAVDQTCILNYYSKDMPYYIRTCDTKHHVCMDITSTRTPLPLIPLICRRIKVFPLCCSSLPLLVGVAGVAVLGCLIRLIIQLIRGSVTYTFRNHKLPSEGTKHYVDKDQYSITNATYAAD